MSETEQHWDVFITAKNTDYPQARQLHDYLVSWGVKSFLSPAVLPTMGRADYRREIDRALESATHMILVASSVENINSRWVEAEWGGFINELRSGRKSGNLLTVIVGTMKVGDLPFALRQYEVVPFDPSLFETILPYVSSTGSLAAQIEIANENERPIPIKKAVQWALEAALGLGGMHRRDLVHRDLKPSNILLDGEGHARVSNLRLVQTHESRLQQGSVGAPHPGTREYMPPEQVPPNTYPLRASADVYALGCVLFELLTGQVYFHHEGTPPSGLRSEVPLWLDDLVMRMLSQEPKERPRDGGEAAELLRQGLEGEQAQRAEEQRKMEEKARQKRETAEREQRERQAAAQMKAERHSRQEAEKQAAEIARLEAEAGQALEKRNWQQVDQA
ncbi:MAG: protein kinase, partial [Anaerolineales bacterium]|nr:protein kinase [Anaerolineales bacterium]